MFENDPRGEEQDKDPVNTNAAQRDRAVQADIDRDMRIHALHLADDGNKHESMDKILSRAEGYLRFLKGER